VAGFARLDPDFAGKRLRELEDEMLLSEGTNPLEIDIRQRRQRLADRIPKMGRCWRELSFVARSARRGEGPGEGADLLPLTKVKLARPTRDATVVDRLLSELDPSDLNRLYRSDRDRFDEELLRMEPVRRRYAKAIVRAGLELSSPSDVPEDPATGDQDIVFV
jgi:hypothetical protein